MAKRDEQDKAYLEGEGSVDLLCWSMFTKSIGFACSVIHVVFTVARNIIHRISLDVKRNAVFNPCRGPKIRNQADHHLLHRLTHLFDL